MKKIIANRYMILSSLGEGGMADVYLALDTILNREVAVKILRGELGKDPVALLRFQREASAVSKLNHPNVVDVYDVGEFEGRHYIVMEYIQGRTLKQLISQRGALHQDEAVNIMMQLTSGVLHAHEHNIIHRDIKPQNVLVKDDGTVKITDFGIALAHDAVQLTQNDAVLGSAHYLAPETTRGETPTNQVDIYALGIVFYELLTGSVPFRGENPVQTAMKHLREEVPSVIEFNPSLSQSVENIIIHATVKNKVHRYQSAKELLYDLEHCLTPAYANQKKLVFVDEYAEPTVNANREREVKKATARKAKTEEITEDKKEQGALSNKKVKIMVAALLGVIALGIVSAIFLMSGSNKSITIPEVMNLTKEEAIKVLVKEGFDEANIKIKEELSDDIETGKVISISPAEGKSAKTKETITLTVSSGKYFVVRDYTNESFTDVEAELKEKAPNVKLVVTKKATTEMKPGYIIAQSGLQIGEKVDPNEQVELHVTVTESVAFRIQGLLGKPIDEAEAIIKEKGIIPVLSPMTPPEPNEGETPVEEGVVVKVDPVEGTWYVQEGTNTITLYYYGDS